MTLPVAELKKRFPVIRGRDHGHPMTLGEIVAWVGKALDAMASEESQNDVAADILDREFLFGAWGDRWKDSDIDLLRDLRGMVIAAYRLGKANSQRLG
jgi:hypothetical protein